MEPDGNLRSERGTESSVDVLRAVIAVARERQVTVTAASVAYYTFSSLIPFALFLVAGLSFVGQFEWLTGFVGGVLGVAPGRIRQFVGSVGGAGRLRAVAIAVVVFIWSALRLFRAVDGAFSRIYGTRERVSVLGRATNAAVAFLTVALALTLLWTIGVALTSLVGGDFSPVLGPPLLFLSLTVVFLPMYYLFPETGVTVGEVLPGTVAAAAAWTVASVGFRIYAETTASLRLYGVAGGLLLVLTWLYVGGLVLLGGAVLNAVLAGRVDPDGEWLPTIRP